MQTESDAIKVGKVQQHATQCVLCNLDNCVKLRELQCGFAILPTLWAVGPLLRPKSETLGAGFGQVSLWTAYHHHHLISARNLAPAIQSPIIQLKQSMEQISLCRGRVVTTSPRVGNAGTTNPLLGSLLAGWRAAEGGG